MGRATGGASVYRARGAREYRSCSRHQRTRSSGTWPSISESVATARASVLRIDEYVEVLLLPGWAWPRRKDMSWLGDGLGPSVETWAHGPWCITRAGLGRDGAASC